MCVANFYTYFKCRGFLYPKGLKNLLVKIGNIVIFQELALDTVLCRKPLAPIDGASFPPIVQPTKTFPLVLLGNHISHSPISGHVIELQEDAPIR